MSRADILTIDPVAMGITNRICKGSAMHCQGDFRGGLIVQGHLEGHCRILGSLIVWESASIKGQFEVFGDIYVFGVLGSEEDTLAEQKPGSEITCHGAIHMAHSAQSHAHVAAQRIVTYDGARIFGAFRTLKNHQQLPELIHEQ